MATEESTEQFARRMRAKRAGITYEEQKQRDLKRQMQARAASMPTKSPGSVKGFNEMLKDAFADTEPKGVSGLRDWIKEEDK
jgi:hypothetical protein